MNKNEDSDQMKMISELEELGFDKDSLLLALKFSDDKEQIINMYVHEK